MKFTKSFAAKDRAKEKVPNNTINLRTFNFINDNTICPKIVHTIKVPANISV